MAVGFTLSQQAWACGCLRKEGSRLLTKPFLPYQIVGFRYTTIPSRHTMRPSANVCRMRNRSNVQLLASQSHSHSQPDSGHSTVDDGEEDEDYEEENPGQVIFEENLEIIMRAGMKLFRKYSAEAIRAMREILPSAISTELIAFGVKGTYCICILWVFKILLEVFCSIATSVFVGLLVVRLAWSIMASAQPRETNWSPQGN